MDCTRKGALTAVFSCQAVVLATEVASSGGNLLSSHSTVLNLIDRRYIAYWPCPKLEGEITSVWCEDNNRFVRCRSTASSGKSMAFAHRSDIKVKAECTKKNSLETFDL